MSRTLNTSEHPAWNALNMAILIPEATGVEWRHPAPLPPTMRTVEGSLFMCPTSMGGAAAVWRPTPAIEALRLALHGLSAPHAQGTVDAVTAVLPGVGQHAFDTSRVDDMVEGWVPIIVHGPVGSLWASYDGAAAWLLFDATS